MTRIDSIVDFEWGFDAPVDSMFSDYYTVQWLGELQPINSDEYILSFEGDDGFRLWVGDELLIDRWISGAIEIKNKKYLEEGVKYPIRIDYFENGGIARAKLHWSTRLLADQPIPSTQLYPSELEQVPEASELTFLYPSPVRDKLNVLLNFELTGSGNFNVYDLNGKLVMIETFDKLLARKERFTIDVSQLPQGMYTLEIDSPFIHTAKQFVKQ